MVASWRNFEFRKNQLEIYKDEKSYFFLCEIPFRFTVVAKSKEIQELADSSNLMIEQEI